MSEEVEDSGFDLGADLAGDFEAAEGPSSDDSAQPQPQPQTDQPQSTEFDPLAANWARLKDEDVPEQWRPLAKIGRTMNANHSAAMQEVRGLQSQLAQREQHYAQLIAQAQQAQRTPQAAQNAIDQAQALLGKYGYRPDGEGYAEAQVVYQIANEIAQSQMQALTPQLQQVQQQIQGVMQYFAQQAQAQQNAQQRTQQAEVTELAGAYTPDQVQPYAQHIQALRGTINPATGQPHTYTSAFELVSGIAAQKAQEQASRGTKAKQQARRQASPTLSAGGAVDGLTMSDADLDAKLAEVLGLRG